MTVKELITELIKFPSDTEIALHINNGGEELETSIEYDRIVLINNDTSILLTNADRRAYNVRKRLDEMKRGNIGVSWTGMRLTSDEFNEGVKIIEAYPDKEKAKKALDIFMNRKPAAK